MYAYQGCFADRRLSPLRRSAFRLQSPFLLIALALIALKTREPPSFALSKTSVRDRIKSIDYLGSIFLVGFSGCLVLSTSMKETQGLAWGDAKVWGLLVAR